MMISVNIILHIFSWHLVNLLGNSFMSPQASCKDGLIRKCNMSRNKIVCNNILLKKCVNVNCSDMCKVLLQAWLKCLIFFYSCDCTFPHRKHSWLYNQRPKACYIEAITRRGFYFLRNHVSARNGEIVSNIHNTFAVHLQGFDLVNIS